MEAWNHASKIEHDVYYALKEVIDPELAVNIVDLGLIYSIEYTKEKKIEIIMTLSSKGCPMGDVIMGAIRNVIADKFPDNELNLELVWEPAWTTERVTNDGRKELGM